jgi:NADH-quinone oxidoreductase subunit N
LTVNDFFSIMPGVVLALFGIVLMLIHLDSIRAYAVLVSVAELLFAVGLWRQTNYIGLEGFEGAVAVDGLGIFLNAACAVAAWLAAISAYRYLEGENEHGPEYFGLLLLAQSGMFFMIAGRELITVFIGLEIAAVCLYALTGFFRHLRTSNEAALKYFLLGAFSSGVLLYGFSMLYGLTGQTHYVRMGSLDRHPPVEALVLLTVIPILIGLLIKIAAAPLHFWAPDAYQGAPTPVAAFLATAGKVAGIAVLFRLLLGPLSSFRSTWEDLIAVCAVASLLVGNFGALTQSSLKRLLAYSSIAHAGYILLGFVSGNRTGVEGIVVYLAAYTVMTAGAFVVLCAFEHDDLSVFRGMLRSQPVFALAVLILLLSLAGLPPTAGFMAKYLIFLSLLQTGHYWLAVVAAVYIAVSLYYYFRIVREMTLVGTSPAATPRMSLGWRAAVGLSTILSLGFGINPEPLLSWARMAIP